MGGPKMIMSLRTSVMVVLCMTAAFASDVDKVVPEEQFNNVQPMYQSLVQNDHDAVDEKKIDPMEDHDHMMFTPHNEEMPKVPAGAGNTEKFTREADAQMTSAHAAKASHELKSVEDRGLAIVEGIMKKRAKAQKMHAKYIMEVAARKYKAKKTEAIKLDKAAQERKAKAKSVKEYAEVAEKAIAKAEAAKKTVKKTKKAKKATKKAKKATKAAKKSAKGKKATKKAKKAHKKAKKAHKKAKKAHKKAKNAAKKAAKKAAKAVKKAAKKAAKGKKCADCVVLDAAYAKQLKGKKNKGSCKDCPTWAKKGFCTSKLYSPFMSKFCRASCHAQNKKAANCGVSK